LKSMYMQPRLTITSIVTIILVSMIYFTIYFHPWFGKLFGREISGKENGIFIALFFYFFIIYLLIFLKKNKIVRGKFNSNKRLFVTLLLYIAFGTFVVILYEEGLDAIKRYLFYLFTPVMVFLSVFGMYRSNKDIEMTLNILLILGVIFAIYSTVLHIMLPTMSYDVISAYYPGLQVHGVDYLARFTVPGLGPNVLPSILTPLVLTGFYFYRNSSGKLKYLYMGATLFLFYNIIISASRGAFVSLTAGMIYLIWKGWFKFNKITLFVVLSFSLVLFVSGDPFFSRIDTTVTVLERALAEGLTDEVGKSEVRLVALIDTFSSYIMHNPILGSGFTYFTVSQAVGEHNLYTTLLAQGGLAVFIPFALILFYLYVNSNKLLKRDVLPPTSKDIGILLNAGLVAYVIDLNFPPGFFHYYWIWFGFVAAWTRNCEIEYCRRRLANEYPDN